MFFVFLAVMIVGGGLAGLAMAATGISFDTSSLPNFTLQFTPNTDDGDGNDWMCVVCYDKDGLPTDVDTTSGKPGDGEQTWNSVCQVTLEGAGSPVTAVYGDPILYGLLATITTQKTSCGACRQPQEKNGSSVLPTSTAVYGDPTVAASGCSPSISSTAVVGRMTSNAMLYYAPHATAMVYPNMWVLSGQTFYVDGVDETGEFRQLLMDCEWLWVDVETVGPNYDYPWYGRALPTHTEE